MRCVALVSALTAAAAAIPAGGSSQTMSDGLWRGTFECNSDGNTLPVAVKPEFKVTNGSGTWYPLNYTPNRNNSPNRNSGFSLGLSIDGADVTVRLFTGHAEQEISGRVEGDSIRASNRSCTLSLARACGGGP